MQPPVKDQSDIGQDEPVIDASSTDENPDRTEQQWKDEADINYMLSRFGITQPRGAPIYGEWNDSIDLQTALEATRMANEAYKDLPKELRDKFTNMQDLLTAVETGELTVKDEPETPAPQTPGAAVS